MYSAALFTVAIRPLKRRTSIPSCSKSIRLIGFELQRLLSAFVWWLVVPDVSNRATLMRARGDTNAKAVTLSKALDTSSTGCIVPSNQGCAAESLIFVAPRGSCTIRFSVAWLAAFADICLSRTNSGRNLCCLFIQDESSFFVTLQENQNHSTLAWTPENHKRKKRLPNFSLLQFHDRRPAIFPNLTPGHVVTRIFASTNISQHLRVSLPLLVAVT
jgi:hypothetical protein